MKEQLSEMAKYSWRLRDLNERDLFTIIGFYSLTEKDPDDILSLLQQMKTPQERDSLSLPTEESLFPQGVSDILGQIYNFGRGLWGKIRTQLHEKLCNKDGSCKFNFDFNDYENLIIAVSAIHGVTLPIAAVLLLIVYKKGYSSFCAQALHQQDSL